MFKNIVNLISNLKYNIVNFDLLYMSMIYIQVCEGRTGHTEAVKVTYDERIISYKSLCDIFWETHDPTNKIYLVMSINFSFIFSTYELICMV